MLKKLLLLFILLPLTITVTAEPTANKTKACWTPPTENTDGTLITDLAGFRIYSGSTSGIYTQQHDVPVPTQTCQSIAAMALVDGEYFMTITAYNTTGSESGYSNEINFTLVSGMIPLLGVPDVPYNLRLE